MSESETSVAEASDILKEITNINKKLEENKTQLGRIKDLGEGKSTIYTELENERERLNLDYEKNARIYAKYAHKNNMGAAKIRYWDYMYPKLGLKERITNAANDYSLPSPPTESGREAQIAEEKHQEGNRHNKEFNEYIEQMKNNQDGDGRITHAERDMQKEVNNMNGDGSISHARLAEEKNANNMNGDGSISHARLAAEKNTNKRNGYGSISHARREREREKEERYLNNMRGLGSIKDDEALIYSPTRQQIPLDSEGRRVSGRAGALIIGQGTPQLHHPLLDGVVAAAFKRDLGNIGQLQQPPASTHASAHASDGPIYNGMGGRRKTRRGRQVRRPKAKRTRREKRAHKSRKVIKRKAHKSRRH